MKYDTTHSVLRTTPTELFAIRVGDAEGGNGAFLAPPADDDGTQVIMCWPSLEQAKRGLAHQIAMGYYEDSECAIVQVL